MRVHVAFTPDEAAEAPTGVVIDVIRATSTICQALAAGYERVWCAADVEDARALRADGVTLGGERHGVRIDGFDLWNSPHEYLEPRSKTLAMSTTNGTRAILETAGKRFEIVTYPGTGHAFFNDTRPEMYRPAAAADAWPRALAFFRRHLGALV